MAVSVRHGERMSSKKIAKPSPQLEYIDVFALGSGQDVGRSCILLRARGQNILLDCGAHLAYHDHRRFPDFLQLPRVAQRGKPNKPSQPSHSASSSSSTPSPVPMFNSIIDALIVTHFHLDHCGALPVFTEQFGYSGPILMTAPTKALVPVLLEDYRRIQADRRGDASFYTQSMIGDAMKKVRCVQLHEEVRVNPFVSVQAFYAGHALGAAMFLIRIDSPEATHLANITVPSAKSATAAPAASSYFDSALDSPHVSLDSSSFSSSVSSSSSSTSSSSLESSFISHRSISVSLNLPRAPLYILYTGDFNHVADRHLGAYQLMQRLPPALRMAAGVALPRGGGGSGGRHGGNSALALKSKKTSMPADRSQNAASSKSPEEFELASSSSSSSSSSPSSAVVQPDGSDEVATGDDTMQLEEDELSLSSTAACSLPKSASTSSPDSSSTLSSGKLASDSTSASSAALESSSSSASASSSSSSSITASTAYPHLDQLHHLQSQMARLCQYPLSVLITESTYAGTVRDSPLAQHRQFVSMVLDTALRRQGKVLIPVFALGKAQELCLLLASCWKRLNLNIPIYFAPGMSQQAAEFFRIFAGWSSHETREASFIKNAYEFEQASTWKSQYKELSGPAVLFATPGMLHAGLSLDVFRAWAPHPNNAVIFPAFCVEGTIGAQVLAGAKQITDPQSGAVTPIRCRVSRVALSVHADAAAIMRLIAQTQPRHVVLVHGEPVTMTYLCEQIKLEFGLQAHMPPNLKMLRLPQPIQHIIPISREAVAAARPSFSLSHLTSITSPSYSPLLSSSSDFAVETANKDIDNDNSSERPTKVSRLALQKDVSMPSASVMPSSSSSSSSPFSSPPSSSSSSSPSSSTSLSIPFSHSDQTRFDRLLPPLHRTVCSVASLISTTTAHSLSSAAQYSSSPQTVSPDSSIPSPFSSSQSPGLTLQLPDEAAFQQHSLLFHHHKEYPFQIDAAAAAAAGFQPSVIRNMLENIPTVFSLQSRKLQEFMQSSSPSTSVLASFSPLLLSSSDQSSVRFELTAAEQTLWDKLRLHVDVAICNSSILNQSKTVEPADPILRLRIENEFEFNIRVKSSSKASAHSLFTTSSSMPSLSAFVLSIDVVYAHACRAAVVMLLRIFQKYVDSMHSESSEL